MKVLPVHSGLPPSAGLASGLKGELLLRPSCSPEVRLPPAAPGTEHYANAQSLAAAPLRSQRSGDWGLTLPPLGSEDPWWLSSSFMGTGREMKTRL